MKEDATALCYDDVFLYPQYSEVPSRSEIDLQTSIGGEVVLEVPILAASMDTITESSMAVALKTFGGLGIIHRFLTIPEQVEEVKKIEQAACRNSQTPTAAAIGVAGDWEERARELVNAGATCLSIDIAHGHHVLMKKTLNRLRSWFKGCVIAGNVATSEGYRDLLDWGADVVKVGIGGGSICTTRLKTAHGCPTLQTIIECADSNDGDPSRIIADGGIRDSGDIVKALAAGAGAVMIGRLLAGTVETPGKVFTHADGSRYKHYTGMAAVASWRGGEKRHVEGVSAEVPARGPVREVLEELCEGIRSGLSYSGAFNLTGLRNRARFGVQTVAGGIEGTPHIFGGRG